MFNKIRVIGLGYVGLAQALLFNNDYDVVGYDINHDKVLKIKEGNTPFRDIEITNALKSKSLKVTNVFNEAIKESDLIIIATPTHFNEETKMFDLSSIVDTLKALESAKSKSIILIKSTLHVGATIRLRLLFPALNIFFSPEFLKEGSALYDNLYPSRIVVGYNQKEAKEVEIARQISTLYLNAVKNKDDVKVFLTSLEEAEAIKLFANAYLALRVSFFNELDTFALTKDLDSLTIIDAISTDPRIGNYYNNPSFGYGGYCLPKDIKQLQTNYDLVPEQLISGTIKSNISRKEFIAQFIIRELIMNQGKTIGVFRLIMKKGSDNFRESSIIDVINILKEEKMEVIIYEPLITDETFHGYKVINDLATFKAKSDLIVTNRYQKELEDIKDKVFTRDLKSRD